MALAFTAPAVAVEPPPYYASFGPDGTEATGFGRAASIAVDQQNHFVYVIDQTNGTLVKFDSEGQPVSFTGSAPYLSGNQITGLSYFSCFACYQVAVDSASHDIYVTSGNSVTAFHADGEPAEFAAGPGAGTNAISGFGELLGVAVDPNGAIYASDFFGGVTVYAHSGEPIAHFIAEQAANIAVDANGVVYVNRWSTFNVLKYSPTAFPVGPATEYAPDKQPFDSNQSFTVAVDPVSNDVYVDRFSQLPSGEFRSKIAWYDESGVLKATFAGPDEDGELGASFGVAVSGDEEKVFVSNAPDPPDSGLSQVEVFWDPSPAGVPRVKSISVADVTGDSATLRAGINPSRAETTYRFEYGLGDCAVSSCASIPITGVSIGDGHKVVAVSQELSGLQANATYHYRVFARNEFGDNLLLEGDHTFTTQPSGLGFQLRDFRAWEMVSPPDKHGALLDGSLNAQVQAAAGGDSLIYPARGSIDLNPEGSRSVEVSTVLARRAQWGWKSGDITLPNDRATEAASGQMSEYKIFNLDLSSALVEPRSNIRLSPKATEKTPYLRDDTDPASYTPLVTGANVPLGTEFGGDPNGSLGPVNVVGTTPDLSHVVLSAAVPLVEEAPPAPAKSLYLWSEGQLQAVSILPAGEGGGIAETRMVGSGAGSTRNAISHDGSRVFWGAGNLSALYVRDVAAGETVRLDVKQSDATGEGETHPIFQGASADGTVVFFTDTQRLTKGSSASGADLYRCEIAATLPATGCSSLVDITSPIEGSGEDTEVRGIAAGVGNDGSTIYFVANGVLDGVANGVGDAPVSGKPNVYVWREGQGVRFIATLSEEDENDWGGEVETTYKLSAASSPSGHYLSFMSQLSLTGKDHLDASSGEPAQQVFRYDVGSDQLDCLSCNPTGAAPNGVAVNDTFRLVDPRFQWIGKRTAAILPQPTEIATIDISLYAPRAVLDNGRVFFNAFDSLVPADSNGQWDVYQYEPIGTGDCTETTGDAATARSAGGCVSLISSGTGEAEAGFLDASETGDDVFFLTPARLNSPDEDAELDVYDARVNGVPATLPSLAECLGEACQAFTAPSIDPTPGSGSYQGPGNVKANKHCPKGKRTVKRKGKPRCVSPKHKKHRKHGSDGKGARG